MLMFTCRVSPSRGTTVAAPEIVEPSCGRMVALHSFNDSVIVVAATIVIAPAEKRRCMATSASTSSEHYPAQLEGCGVRKNPLADRAAHVMLICDRATE